MSTAQQFRRLRKRVSDAEICHQSAARAAYKQRETVAAAQNADVMARGNHGIPRPVGGPNRPLAPTQITLQREREKLAELEMALSTATSALNDARGELLAAQEGILSCRREVLALKVIAHTASTEEVDELLALVPDQHHVRIDQMFYPTPLVAHAVQMAKGTNDSVNMPCSTLNASTPVDWDEVRARVLDEYA
jgi:hypothetical protein